MQVLICMMYKQSLKGIAPMLFGKPMKNMSPREVKIGLDGGDVVLVDVREINEHSAAHIDGCCLVPLSSFDVAKLPKCEEGKTLVLYCQGGMRSAQAVKACQKAGIENVANMAGGIMAWAQNGLPLKK